MRLEEQCVSLDLAKRLKELGLKQESLWHWTPKAKIVAGGQILHNGSYLVLAEQQPTYGSKAFYSAFTVAELGEMLPASLILEGDGRYYEYEYEYRQCLKGDTGFRVWYENPKDGNDFHLVKEADTEADARAKMLCYLLENRLTTIRN